MQADVQKLGFNKIYNSIFKYALLPFSTNYYLIKNRFPDNNLLFFMGYN